MLDRKVELIDLDTNSYYVDDLYDFLKTGSLAESRTDIKRFTKEVRVNKGNEAVLSYSVPILPEKVVNKKEGVQPSVIGTL
jgi:hypothetical protein